MSPAPYYQADGITLYHGDSREITEWLAADVLVTDPPYGMAYRSNRSKYKGPSDAIAGDRDPGLRDDTLVLWGTERPGLVFGHWTIPRPAGTRQVVIWDKGDSPGTGDLRIPWGPGHEEIYAIGNWPPRPKSAPKRSTSVVRVATLAPGDANRPDHPTPKPIPLMERLIERCPVGIVADPFAGSGATLVAARNLGRPAVGVELEERYCEIIARRFDQQALFVGATG